ncbi:hypothetical protein [Mycoplasma phocimorsus]|uniref:hypothetical protein n=1 Tax=Mycoplasma phocimorsus TaxID=3045839 RepID=UPI0024C0D80D|nr:hypothetical protein [Mycoplasma phocimorsus]MDJ1649060.1 hypothetical protein [Mycoplasma phocimorsus]
MPNSILKLFKEKNHKNWSFWSKLKFKDYLLGGFLSLVGTGALAGIGYGIYKGAEEIKKWVEYQKQLDQSNNWLLTFEVTNEKYKDKNWSIYTLNEEGKNGQIGSFLNKNNQTGDFKKETNGKFTIKLENINVPDKIEGQLKFSNNGETDRTWLFKFKDSKNNELNVYLLDDYNYDRNTYELKLKENAKPVGKVRLIKTI